MLNIGILKIDGISNTESFKQFSNSCSNVMQINDVIVYSYMVNDIANSTNSDYLTNKSELIVNVPNSQGLKHNKTLNMKNKDQNKKKI